MAHRYIKGDQTREDILAFIIKHLKEHGYAPSYREIGAAVGLKSTSSIYFHVQTMLKEGMLETDTEPMEARALRVPEYEFAENLSAGEQIEMAKIMSEIIDLKEKSTPLKPKETYPGLQLASIAARGINRYCARCSRPVTEGDKYCNQCGQAQKWKETKS